jgi:hypothetical protein
MIVKNEKFIPHPLKRYLGVMCVTMEAQLYSCRGNMGLGESTFITGP